MLHPMPAGGVLLNVTETTRENHRDVKHAIWQRTGIMSGE